MLKKIKPLSLITVLLLGVFASTVFAADINDASSEQATRDLVTQTDLLKNNQSRLPVASEAPVIEQEKEKQQEKQDEGPVFLVQKIVFKNNTLVKQEELSELAKSVEGKKVSFGEMQRFAEMVTGYYRARGYTTTRAYIPPQKVIDGVVTIQIMEGRVGEIGVEGNKWFKKSLYRGAIPFAAGAFFDMAEMETAIREINVLPDRAVKAYLEPGKAPGTTDITLKAKDKFPVHASYEFNLRGTKLTHRARHIMHLTHNNLLGFGDSLESSLTLAEQGAILGSVFNYEVPVQATGTVFSFAAAFAKSRLQGDLREFEVEGKSMSLMPGVLQKIWYGPRAKFDWSLRFEVKDSKTTLADEKISYDRMRVLTTGPRMKIFDKWGQTLGAMDAHIGIPGIMGGSRKDDINASRLESGGQFVYGTATVARLQPLPYELLAVFQAVGQYSPVPLTSLEQMNLGGMYSVRGYPENDSSGDTGYTLSTELRVPPYFIPKKWKVPGFEGKTWRDAISLVGFIDGGQVFNYKRQQASSEKNRSLVGTGFGARFYLSPDFNIQFDYGFPFGEKSTAKDHPQIHLSARIGL